MRQGRFGTSIVFRSADQDRIDAAAVELLAFASGRAIDVEEIY
jgi:hypothetical protein